MSVNNSPTPVPSVGADPKRPWKAIVAAAAPILVGVVYAALDAAKDLDGNPPWVSLLITAVLSGVGTFSVKNPKKVLL